MSRIIGVDVDLTVCPSDIGWSNWLQERTKGPKNYIEYLENKPYNLSELYGDVENPFEYWRTLEYSQFKPSEGSVEKLEQLSKYFSIVFISAIKGRHNKEKYYWLKSNFPFMKGYMATKEKFLMNGSVVAMIDDRLDNLQGFDSSKRVLYSTPYKQSVECDVAYTINNWESFSVKDFCNEYL